MNLFSPVRRPERFDLLAGVALFAVALAALWLTQAAVGFVRDESFYFYAAQNHAGWLRLLFTDPSAAFSDAAISQSFGYNQEHPGLMKNLYGLSWLVLHRELGLLGPAAAFRLPAFLLSAACVPVLYRMGAQLYGRTAGLFAAAAWLLVPRQFFNSQLAAFDVPVAAFWLFTVYAFWQAQRRPLWWLWCGVFFGLGLATKHNTFFLPVVIAPFALYLAFFRTRAGEEARAWVWRYLLAWAVAAGLCGVLVLAWGPQGVQDRFHLLSPQTFLYLAVLGVGGVACHRLRRLESGAFAPLASALAMAALGPLLLYVLWPWLWHHPVERTASWMAFHLHHNHYAWFYLGTLLRQPPFPLEYVLVKTALTVPTSLFVPMALGALGLVARYVARLHPAVRPHVPVPGVAEALVGVNAAFSILLISHPEVPHFGGVKHWFPSMMFLGLLGGQVVNGAAGWARDRLGERAKAVPWAVALGLCLLLFAPALWAGVRIHPYGTSAYSELAGGAPGAASLGMQRQFWSNNVTGVLPWINEHAPPNARVFFHEVTPLAVRYYKENGLLRQDLRAAGGPFDADLVAYQYHQEFREHEFNAWQSTGSARPVTGLYIDETPQVVVYQR